MITMQPIGFIEAFMQIYIAVASLVIIFLITSILFTMHKVDKGLFKARLFLNDAVMQKTWIYISIAGASFALNALIMLLVKFVDRGQMFVDYYIVEITQIIFLMAFFFATFNWYEFISGHKRSEIIPH